MKKLFLLPLAAATILVSCGEGGESKEELKAEAKNELEKQEIEAEYLSEHGASDPVDYNDGLLAQVTLVQVKFIELQDLDDQDVSDTEMMAACQAALAEADKVTADINKIEPFGTKGDIFKQAALNLVRDIKPIFQLYNDFASKLSTPDEEWSEEDLVAWDDAYNGIYEAFAASYDNFGDVQEEYAAVNGFTFGEEIDPNAIYEESK